MIYVRIIFWISAFMIFWANIGYPLSILLLGKIIKKQNIKNYSFLPTVTLMIVAHNEEKVILDKLQNAIQLDYPKEKFKILITSDNSTDKTNEIVKKFIKSHQQFDIELYNVKQRKGKTNAQNEAAKNVKTEILVMTDANSILAKNAIKELVASFSSEDIVYVSGKLNYTNKNDNITSHNENTYWDIETKVRDIESRIQTIIAGNGALYACRTRFYFDANPIRCHDSIMPLTFALLGKRAIANNNALAYEKAGENNKDEFKRKVRMNRGVIYYILPSIKIINAFKYKWYTYFYLGHKTSRCLLWFNHILLFISNIFLLKFSMIYILIACIQLFIYLLAILKIFVNYNNKIFNYANYYCMTILAQFVGAWNTLIGKNKPFWEKAESTR